MRAHTYRTSFLAVLRVGSPGVRVLTLAAASLILTPAPSHADVFYKWKDANGTIVYSDRAPQGRPAQRVEIETRSPDPQAAAPRLESERAKWAQADAEREAHKRAEEEQRRLEAQQRAERCRQAQRQHARFSVDGRHYRLDERGERVYYSAQDIDRERAESQKQMKEFCGPAPRSS